MTKRLTQGDGSRVQNTAIWPPPTNTTAHELKQHTEIALRTLFFCKRSSRNLFRAEIFSGEAWWSTTRTGSSWRTLFNKNFGAFPDFTSESSFFFCFFLRRKFRAEKFEKMGFFLTTDPSFESSFRRLNKMKNYYHKTKNESDFSAQRGVIPKF